jgi:hypothetical protein
MTERDFTLKKYTHLCEAIVSSSYIPLTVKEFLNKDQPDKSIILRHDVDRKPDRALKMAVIENEHGIRSTYYFRTVKEVFQPDIIRNIAKLGHEIGYHYEVLDKAKGDVKKAIEIFGQELKDLREIAPIKTICMHGNPLTSWENRDLWTDYSFDNFGITGEAYLSIDFKKVSYFTDTGRAWNSSKHSVKDIVQDNPYGGKIGSTSELMNLIINGSQRNICILIHPNRWTDDPGGWVVELAWQNIKNIGKRLIKNRKVSHD